MHKEVLKKEQENLLILLEKFKENFILVGGTAIALQIGHRESIDFDLVINHPEIQPCYMESKGSPLGESVLIL